MFLNYQKSKIELIAIKDCRHFRGYRYGLYSNNIYEDYIVGISRGVDLQVLRLQFVKRIIGTRTTNFAETLGIVLSKKAQNWDYPWNMRTTKTDFTAFNNPDIVCHTSTDGKILISHLNREFTWLENAFANIKNEGYLPEKNSYITVLKLVSQEKNSYIVLDGNHRISTLAALGISHCKMRVLTKFLLHENLHYLWFGYLFRQYTTQDSLSIFLRYFWDSNPEIKESDDFSSLIHDEISLIQFNSLLES